MQQPSDQKNRVISILYDLVQSAEMSPVVRAAIEQCLIILLEKGDNDTK